ncbi:aspartic proteinase 36-like [Lycium ferocissimum]|uniref:aspartic proteinase 36-like n=1 Tax=Lycium ferocissimum TaxID=112874 RepID=UPI0028163C2A|nr:aspartic proteinase 36-like [Lycium ferocissimum]
MHRKFVFLVPVFCIVVASVMGQTPVGAKATTPPAASPTKTKTPAPAKAPATAPTIPVVTAPVSTPPARVLLLERVIYYTKVKLGSPPNEYKVVIDTGSDISWVTCSSCEDCPGRSGLGFELNFYDSASSSTASVIPCSDRMCSWGQCSSRNQCAYTVHYEDMSGTTGYFVSDLLHLDTILGSSLIASSSTPFVLG